MKASAPQEGTSVEHVRRQIDPDTRLGTIYAGNRYVFGFAPDYYGIWDEFARDAAVEKFPATDEGRAQAWQRIVELDPAAGEPHQAMIAASRPRLEQARRRKRWPYVVVGLVVVIGAIIVIVVARSGGGGETAGSGGGPVGKTAHIDVSGAQTASEDLTLASFKASGTQAVFGGTVDASWKGPTLELRIQLGSPSTGNLNTTEAGTYRAVTLTITPTGGTPTQIVSSHGECTVTVDTITDSAFVGEIDCGSLPLPGGAGTISASGSFSGGS